MMRLPDNNIRKIRISTTTTSRLHVLFLLLNIVSIGESFIIGINQAIIRKNNGNRSLLLSKSYHNDHYVEKGKDPVKRPDREDQEYRTHEFINSSRRSVFLKLFNSLSLFLSLVRAANAEEIEQVDEVAKTKAFGDVRYQLENPEGGVAYMEKCIDSGDFQAIMKFTPEYDLELRKKRMKAARKFVAKDSGVDTTSILNAVTFDLIGINRASRPGQENTEEARKYLNELKADVQKLLDLQ